MAGQSKVLLPSCRGAIRHAHGSNSFDDAVVTLEGLAATRHVRVDIPAVGEVQVQCSYTRSAVCPRGREEGRRARFGPGRMLTTQQGYVEPFSCARKAPGACEHRRVQHPAILASLVHAYRLIPPCWLPPKTIDTVAMVIYFTSAKLLQLSRLLEAWPPARTVGSQSESCSLMGKILLQVSEVDSTRKCFRSAFIPSTSWGCPLFDLGASILGCVWGQGAP